jgi:hypothetical protein
VPSPDGTTGLHRRAEAFWFPGRSHPDGWFCTDLASGSATSTGNANCAGGVPQYVAPTLGNDARPEFGVNRLSVTAERTFPGGGSVQLPN